MKCRYSKTCNMYNSKCITCNDDDLAGNYYGDDRPCGCYRNQKESKVK
jgi:hypothetical protein